MRKNIIAFFALFVLLGSAHAGPTDILNPPPLPAGGWGLAHNNIGQSFNAVASDVTIGVYVADQETYNQVLQAWANTCAPACGVSAWDPTLVVSPTVSLDVTVYEGEGLGGRVIYTSPAPITLAKPFNGVASVDLGAAGVFLTVGQQYTVIYNEATGTGTYWQFFATIDRTPTINPVTGQIDPNYNHGAYYGGWAYIQGVQQNPDSNIGDVAFQVIDNNPPVIPTACQGTSAIVAGLNSSKLFMTLANGQKVAYTNVYGSPGTTQFTFNGVPYGSFAIGNVVTYVGALDASTICVPSSLTVDPPVVVTPPPPTCVSPQVLQGNVCVTPTPVVPTCTGSTVLDPITNTCVTTATPTPPPFASCVVPSGAKKVEGHAKITAVGTNSITVGKTVVYFADCTVREMNGGASSFAIGQIAEFKGFKANGSITATKITIN